MKNCIDKADLTIFFYDKTALTTEQRSQIAEHLLTCASCRLEIEGLKEFSGQLQSKVEQTPVPDMKAAVLKQLTPVARPSRKPWVSAARVWVPIAAVLLLALSFTFWQQPMVSSPGSTLPIITAVATELDAELDELLIQDGYTSSFAQEEAQLLSMMDDMEYELQNDFAISVENDA